MTDRPGGDRQDRAERHRRDRKTRDRATVLVVIGLVLLMPPFAIAFQLDIKLLGVPFTLLYLFAVWAVLILCAARLAPALKAMDERGADPTAPTAGPDGGMGRDQQVSAAPHRGKGTP